jgi:cytochrome c oxidase subunit 2
VFGQNQPFTAIRGPDLTHFGGRLSIGAGAVPNTAGNLGGWISDSQAFKPGNRMPPIPLSGPDLQALIAYLQSLE